MATTCFSVTPGCMTGLLLASDFRIQILQMAASVVLVVHDRETRSAAVAVCPNGMDSRQISILKEWIDDRMFGKKARAYWFKGRDCGWGENSDLLEFEASLPVEQANRRTVTVDSPVIEIDGREVDWDEQPDAAFPGVSASTPGVNALDEILPASSPRAAWRTSVDDIAGLHLERICCRRIDPGRVWTIDVNAAGVFMQLKPRGIALVSRCAEGRIAHVFQADKSYFATTLRFEGGKPSAAAHELLELLAHGAARLPNELSLYFDATSSFNPKKSAQQRAHKFAAQYAEYMSAIEFGSASAEELALSRKLPRSIRVDAHHAFLPEQELHLMILVDDLRLMSWNNLRTYMAHNPQFDFESSPEPSGGRQGIRWSSLAS